MVFRISAFLMTAFLISQAALAKDAFEHIKCGSNIAKTLAGKKTTADTSKSTIDKLPQLQLKDLGGSGTDGDPYHVHSWKICGEEYILAYDMRNPARHSTISDAIKLPPYSERTSEIFEEDCMVGEKVIRPVFGVFSSSKEKDAPAVSEAWVLDQKTMKFKSISTNGLQCPKRK